MERIASKLREYSFVKSVRVIPPNYMVSKGGFTHLEQTRKMFGVDVIVLISYDQGTVYERGFLVYCLLDNSGRLFC